MASMSFCSCKPFFNITSQAFMINVEYEGRWREVEKRMKENEETSKNKTVDEMNARSGKIYLLTDGTRMKDTDSVIVIRA
jgi:hypothetical protein